MRGYPTVRRGRLLLEFSLSGFCLLFFLDYCCMFFRLLSYLAERLSLLGWSTFVACPSVHMYDSYLSVLCWLHPFFFLPWPLIISLLRCVQTYLPHFIYSSFLQLFFSATLLFRLIVKSLHFGPLCTGPSICHSVRCSLVCLSIHPSANVQRRPFGKYLEIFKNILISGHFNLGHGYLKTWNFYLKFGNGYLKLRKDHLKIDFK